MKFVRYGGLSAVDYKNRKYAPMEFHIPPARRGIYAFIDPYVEAFLWYWKLPKREFEDTEEGQKLARRYYRKLARQMRRVFEYDGPIWCHFCHLIDGIKRKAWVLTDTTELAKVLCKVIHEDKRAMQKDTFLIRSDNKKMPPVNPYIRGLGGYISRDHLEVFIEGKYLARIA